MTRSPIRLLRRLLGPGALVLAVCLAGCGSQKPAGDGPGGQDQLSAGEILRKMVERYQQADSYVDDGRLTLRYEQAGQPVEQTEPLRVAFVRPNKLLVSAYNVRLGCDGKVLRYKVVDEPSGDMDNQFVSRPAPEQLDLKELFDRDPILNHFLSGVAGPPVAMELLLSRKPLEAFFRPQSRGELLADQACDGYACYHVRVTTDAGTFQLWIDRQTFVLRRFAYPAKAFLQPLAEAPGIRQPQLVAHLRAAKLGGTVERPFTLPVPDGAKQVKYFVTLPPPLPTDLFGKRPSPFRFTDPAGGFVQQSQLDGHVAVLVWFNNQPACQINLEQLEKIYQQYKGNDKVRFYAVCTEPSASASHQDLVALLGQWNVTVPLVRDLEPAGPGVFGITELPTVVVLDDRGRVQYFEVLAEPHLQQVLPVVIQRLLDGDDLAAEILLQYRQELGAYRRALAIAGADEAATPPPLPPDVPVARRKDAQHLQITPLWTCRQLKAPGNILPVTMADGTVRLYIHDGWRSVVELDAGGKLLERHVLDLPERAGVTYLRAARDEQGRRWLAACEVLGRQVHLLDQSWRLVASYPPPDQQHGGIRDVLLADLHADGSPELYVGFWELLGVHQVSLDGRCLNRNRIAAKVMSLAASVPNVVGWRKLLVADERGSIVAMNHVLNHDPPADVPGYAIHQLYASPVVAEDGAVYCGLSYQEEKVLLAVGLDSKLQPLWTYRLPGGIFQTQVQPVVAFPLLDGPGFQWIFARPDGSIHLVGHDGQLRDSFNTGGPLQGIAATRFGHTGVLIISQGNRVVAMKVRRGPSD